ncbi:DNA-3-methyladenine glycosylase I [Aliikangiella sp. G2MR2-5]|uniref:DNA-3-methyladenine glycosylase I n=1 Tax=Aliikangiella sp. G2MR2-5 TaxID=2788943 RepID=UPI0018ABE525|nr:DNA-3-methyladenine glycosylase I [Aliikangiella sp. G2MR2-5]
MSQTSRCPWVGKEPIYIDYHDREWGIPVYDDLKLFEQLLLEGAQAGLSWITVLKKRENYRHKFHRFDPVKIANMTDSELEVLLQDPSIIRNRLKVYGFRKNALAYLRLSEEMKFSQFLWQFVEGEPINNRWTDLSQLPATTEQSDNMSKALKKRGFTFVGSTICYAFMQAVGMVNDHTTDCFCYDKTT